ncbi:EBNA-1 nuclear protein [Luteimonas sp. FCS-9]|nr:EBNA-1 nuclear protein [Luteimonas sp. FCS-9]
MRLRAPYLLFLGEEASPLKAKTAFGLRDWAPERCLAQLRMPGCGVDLGLPDLAPRAAAQAGARALVIGVTPPGGRIQTGWTAVLREAVEAGLDIVSGLHTPLESVPGLAEAARAAGVALVDVRRPPDDLPRATGRRRSGRRVLAVGTDCALGKKYTALALARAMRGAGVDADFRATGQTGVMIAGRGIAIDAVVADFIAGAAECIAPAAAPEHWDVIEGQGSLFHPAYAGVTLGLLHGAQADALVLCHDPVRRHLVSWPDYPVRGLRDAAGPYVEAARLTNPGARIAAVSLNTSALAEADALQALDDAARTLGVPAFDPLRTPADRVVASILS